MVLNDYGCVWKRFFLHSLLRKADFSLSYTICSFYGGKEKLFGLHV